jgi:tRNA (cmo5U34)-methyltransferase
VAVPGRFGADEAPGYDARMAQLVPGYALLHRLVLAELTAALPAAADVLVVGAGTGAELELLATARPEWRFTAVAGHEGLVGAGLVGNEFRFG